MSKKEFNKKVVIGKFVIILLVGIVLGISCLFSSNIEKALGIGKKEDSFVELEVIEDSKLTLHYINVGQGDATFIELPDNTTMLIDAGTEDYADTMVQYIKNLGVSQIDYFVLTHSDADHSGGADEVLEAFEIKNIYRPFQIAVDDGVAIDGEDLGKYYEDNSSACNIVSTTTYKKFIELTYQETYTEEDDTITESEVWVFYDGLTITSADTKETFLIEFFAPFKISNTSFEEYDSGCNTKGYPVGEMGKVLSNNDSSPIILLEYEGKSFLFTGDAGTGIEKDLINSLSASERTRFTDIDVYQAGHHGANNSNSQNFIDLTTPDYVVVSAGKNNQHGHPTEEFLEKIDGYTHSINDYLLRTDLMDNIVIGFDSEGNLAYAAVSQGAGSEVTVYWWYIALGLFIAITIVVISVKVTKNKKATAKRVVSKSRKVSKLYKKH